LVNVDGAPRVKAPAPVSTSRLAPPPPSTTSPALSVPARAVTVSLPPAPWKLSTPVVVANVVPAAFTVTAISFEPELPRLSVTATWMLSAAAEPSWSAPRALASTLAKLLQRLYVPETGRVLVDGVDLTVADPAWLRRQTGVVLQENVLFNRTVRENIALADPGMSMERVIAAAKLAGAHEFILALPEGYGTVIGERGATLSGGQRQRIAIARALIGNPRILIFDEATSALDYESEAAIQVNMRQICQDRTVILIAHRLSTLRGADRIVTLERGQIVEDGNHASLLAAGGRYAQLWALQSGQPPQMTVVAR
jgi:ABC-type transport system involved in Fe-S cluster assembly fused permease/ATPase subunit